MARGKEDLLVTKNLVAGESVYGEKRIALEGPDNVKTEYRVWNPFRSKLAAGILGGVDNIYIAPGKKVLYLGAASGTTVSHVADIVGPVRHYYYRIYVTEFHIFVDQHSTFTIRKVSYTRLNSRLVPVVT